MPSAIERSPPSDFFSAISVATKKYAFRLLIYIEYTYSLYPFPPHFFSRTPKNITIKHRVSFAFAFECRRNSRITNNQHSFASSNEKLIVVGTLRSKILMLSALCRTNYLEFLVGTRNHAKHCSEKKSNF